MSEELEILRQGLAEHSRQAAWLIGRLAVLEGFKAEAQAMLAPQMAEIERLKGLLEQRQRMH